MKRGVEFCNSPRFFQPIVELWLHSYEITPAFIVIPGFNFTAHWRQGGLDLTIFGLFLLLGCLTLPFPSRPPSQVELTWGGVIQLLTLLLLMVILFCISTFTSFLRGQKRTTLPLSLFFGLIGYVILRMAANSLWGVPMLSPGLISLLTLLAVMSSALSALGTYLRLRTSQRHAYQRTILDPLTEFLNRFGLQQDLLHLPSAPVVLAVLDVNQLKVINDQYGHSEGDRYLQTISQHLKAHLADETVLCRWGGDEFVILFPGHSQDEVRKILTTVQQAIPSVLPGICAFSFGTAVFETTTQFERAFALADHQMYEEKQQQALTGDPATTDLGLYAFSQQLETLATPEEVIRTGLARTRTLLHFDMATYIEVSANGMLARHLDRHPAVTALLPGFVLNLHVPLTPMPALVVRTGATVISVDYPNHPLAFTSWIEAGVKTTILTPVLIAGQVVGILTLIHLSTWKVVTLEMQRMLELAALRFGHALELFQVAETTRANLEGGLLGLGVALEARDLETHGHTERVVEMAVRLGTLIGLTGQALNDLRQGAFLHDLGKLSIPDAILLKPGALTSDEWEVMKSHTVLGADIASRIPNLSVGALEVIRSHHERWDGKGYPDGLVGEQIPLNARIFSVCDVFDALTHERPYKAAWRWEDARAEITHQRERQFCPLVVDTFLALTVSGPTKS